MEYFDKILHTYTFQHYLLTVILQYISLFDGRGFAENQLKIWDKLVKMRITLESCGIFTPNFVYFCTLTLSSHCHAKL